jgi:Putative Zn-dependent protease, contains TPR repeats
MKEDSELYFSEDDNLPEIVKRYEAMVKTNRIAYFDVCDYEKMVDHYILQNRSEDAINVLRIARKQHPNSSELTIKKAEIELFSGHYNDALVDLTSVEAFEKNNPDFYLVKGKTLMATGKTDEALAMFDQVLLKSTDQKLDMLFEVVAILEEYDEFELACKYLKMGIELDPANTQTYGELGFIQEKLNRTEEAIEAYEKMLDGDPFLPFGWSNLGTLYAKLGKNDKAIEAFDYAIALEPDASLSYFSKANALANNGRFDEALTVFFEYAEMEEDTGMAMCCIGECYEKLGDYENAGIYYRKSLESNPENPDALYGLAVVEMEFDHADESYELATKAIEIDPNIPEYWFGLGKLNMRLNNLEEAKAAFETAVALDPQDFESWLLLSEIAGDESLQQGVDVIKRGLESNADVAALHYRLAAYYYLQENVSGSLDEFEKGLVLDNETAEEFFEFCADAVNDPRYLEMLKRHLPSKN